MGGLGGVLRNVVNKFKVRGALTVGGDATFGSISSPGAIGGKTPAAGAFTSVTGSSHITSEGVGAVVGTGNTVVEGGAGVIHKSVITMTNTAIALSDDGNDAYGGMKIYDFPLGWIYFLGIVADIALTKSSAGVNDDWDGDMGFGTVVVADETTPLAGTDVDLVPITATPQATSGATTADCQSTTTEIDLLDGHATAKDVCINFMVDDADHDVTSTPCNLICNGTVTITWVNLGDN